MRNIPQYVCGVIPPHILTRVAERTDDAAQDDARATLEQMRELATGRARTLIEGSPAAGSEVTRNAAMSTTPVISIACRASWP
ncbi:MAG TPA: protealysin propeptide domain-containing protein [Thermoanaerobaculia bacterium]|jgi:hypothetical protein